MRTEAQKREHDALRGLVARLKKGLAEASAGREPLAAALRPLLAALFQHVAGAAGRSEAEHLALRSLARDLQLVLENDRLYPVEHLARLSGALADALLAHLDDADACGGA